MNSNLIIEQPGEGQKELVKAPVINRVIAKLIDCLIVIALIQVLPKIGFVAGAVYIFIADALFQGRSVGKRLLGLQVVYYVVNDTIAPCGYKESVFRNSPFAAGYLVAGVLSLLPLLGWILAIVVISIIIVFEGLVMFGSEEGKRFGDEIANTHVIESKEGGMNVS